MSKKAKEYVLEDFYNAACQARATMFWSWCIASISVIGMEKTIEIMQLSGEEAGKKLAKYWLSYWGVDTMDTALVIETAEIIHGQVGYDAPWTIISSKEAYETVVRCQINDLTPVEYKTKGIPKFRCRAVTENLYPNLVNGTRIEVLGGMCEGREFCRFWIKPL